MRRLSLHEVGRSAAPLLVWAAAFPCLWAWLLIRLAIPFSGLVRVRYLLPVAALLAAGPLWLWGRLDGRKCLPAPAPWSVILGGGAFLLGCRFDLSFAMLSGGELALAENHGFRLLCHGGNGLLFALLVLSFCHSCGRLRGLGRVSPRELLVLVVLLNAVTAYYAATARTVYVWDNAGYWTVARTLAGSPLSTDLLWQVWESTLTLDYNYLLALPISRLMRVFGGSRTVFLFAISNLYTLPGLWGLCVLGKKQPRGGLYLTLALPMLIYVGLVGYVDTAAASLAIWAYAVYTAEGPGKDRGWVAGVLLVLTFLLRRYFFFFAASFGLAALAVKLLFDRRSWEDFLALFTGCAAGSLLLTYAFLLDKVLGTDYGDLYSAYDLGLKSDGLLLCRYFGLAVLLIALCSAGVCLFRAQQRRELTFALVQALSCFGAFVLVQSHGQQHLLMYLPAVAILLLSLLPEKGAPRRGLPALLWSGLIFAVCLFPKEQPASIQDIQKPDLFPSFQFYGPVREDIEELLALDQAVNDLSLEEPHTAVVLSSSFLLNDETLTHLHPSLGLPTPAVETTIQYHGTVDKRDAFNWNTATADYLIIGDPIQTHLGVENQQVMAQLAQAVLDGVGPGTAYAALPESFTLSDGSQVRIYRRERDWAAEDYHSISDALTQLYPDYAALYAVPAWVE